MAEQRNLKAWSSKKDVLSSADYNSLLFYFRQTKKEKEVEEEEQKLFTEEEVKDLLATYRIWWKQLLQKKEAEELEKFLKKQQEIKNLPTPPTGSTQLIAGSRTGRSPWMGQGLNTFQGGYLIGDFSKSPFRGGITSHPWSRGGFWVDPNAGNYEDFLAKQRRKAAKKKDKD